MAKIPDVDTSFMTKTQKKFRIRVLQQENGNKLLSGLARKFFSMKHLIKAEHIQARLIAANPVV